MRSLKYAGIFLIGVAIVVLFLFIFFNKPFEYQVLNKDAKFLKEEGGGEIFFSKENILFDSPYFIQTTKPDFFPIRNWSVSEPDLKEKAGIAILFSNNRQKKILYQKNIEKKLPIASLTKLVTAMVALDIYNKDDIVEISKNAVLTEGTAGDLKVNEKIKFNDLLNLLLVASSNDAATALAEKIGEDNFVNLMNEKVLIIGAENTHFCNVHGLSDCNSQYSTSQDLADISYFIFQNYPEIIDIISRKEVRFISLSGYEHFELNTNKLLGEENILGGKTGFTKEAGDCILLFLKPPENLKDILVILLLGTDDRTLRAREFIDWLKIAYLWK
mgnify:FL=1